MEVEQKPSAEQARDGVAAGASGGVAGAADAFAIGSEQGRCGEEGEGMDVEGTAAAEPPGPSLTSARTALVARAGGEWGGPKDALPAGEGLGGRERRCCRHAV